VRVDFIAALFLSLLWARASDVGIAQHGLPSLVVPFAVVLLGYAMWRRLLAGERLGPKTFNTVFPLLPYLVVVSLSVIWSSFTDGALSTTIDLSKNLLIFWVLVELLHNQRTYKAACVALVLVAGTLSVLSIHQYVTGNFSSDYAGFAQSSIHQIVDKLHSQRIAGPIGDPNFYALILLVTVPLGLALLRTELSGPLRVGVIASVAGAAAAVLLTYSRGGALVLGLGCLVSLARWRVRGMHVAIVAVALAAGLPMVPSSVWDRLGTVLRPFQDSREVGQVIDTSVALRLGAQRVALEMFMDNPFFGVGAGNYPPLYPAYSQQLGVTAVAAEFYPHNLYLQVLAETGAIGLLAFVPAVFGPLVALERTRRAAGSSALLGPEWQELAFGTEIALACYLLSSTMLHGSYPRYLWMLLALAVAARRLAILPRRVHY
jgi:putative inorganic carbon (hco3(-)) transporter